MHRLIALLVALAVAGLPAAAASYYTTPDVPADLAFTTYLPSDVVRNDSGTYASVLGLPAGTAIDALHRMNGGDWLFSVEAPTDLGGTTYEPRDVIRYDGGTYTLLFDGSANGVPAYADVDAVFLAGGDSGLLVVSFDVPTTIASVDYEPSDLVSFAGGAFASYFDASAVATPIPISSNVTGADVREGTAPRFLLTLDVPTTLGGNDYLPGEIVVWDSVSSSFSSFYADPGWPAGSRADGFSNLATPGIVPPTITVGKSSTPGNIVVAWSGVTCSVGAEDYGIYEGTITTPWTGYDHAPVTCTDTGADLNEDFTPAAASSYYLVVPNNPGAEGSYGLAQLPTGPAERPQGSPACRPQEIESCP